MRFLVRIAINAVAVYLTAYVLPGVHLHDFWKAVLVALVLAILNVTLKPLLVLLTIPFTIFTLGLFLLVVNAIIILVASWLLKPDFEVDGFWWALLFSVIVSMVNSILENLVLADNDRPE